MGIDGIKTTQSPQDSSNTPKPEKKKPTKRTFSPSTRASQVHKRSVFIAISMILVVGITIVEVRINWSRIQENAPERSGAQTYTDAINSFQEQLEGFKSATDDVFDVSITSTTTPSSTIPAITTDTAPAIQGASINTRLPE